MDCSPWAAIDTTTLKTNRRLKGPPGVIFDATIPRDCLAN